MGLDKSAFDIIDYAKKKSFVDKELEIYRFKELWKFIHLEKIAPINNNNNNKEKLKFKKDIYGYQIHLQSELLTFAYEYRRNHSNCSYFNIKWDKKFLDHNGQIRDDVKKGVSFCFSWSVNNLNKNKKRLIIGVIYMNPLEFQLIHYVKL